MGQRERVALGAVLVARPGVILLDEPTRGMDPARKAALADLLRARAAEGAAVLVATHDAAFAHEAGDRALTMAGGGAGRRRVPSADGRPVSGATLVVVGLGLLLALGLVALERGGRGRRRRQGAGPGGHPRRGRRGRAA